MKVGFGIKELPSPVGVELCGYGYYLKRVCEGILDPLNVRCVAFSAPGFKTMLISADLIGLTEELQGVIRRLIADRLGFSGEELLLVCTHTHTGPATNYLEGCGVMDEAYNSRIPACFLAAAEDAVADMAEAFSMDACCQPIESIGFNRNIKGGANDSVVRGVLLKRASKAPVAIISYPCHPVVLGPARKCSADYPGAVCRLGEEKGMKTIYLNGCCGDIDPVVNQVKWGSGTPETNAEYAERILKGFEEGLKPAGDSSLAHCEFNTVLPLRKLDAASVEEIAQKGANKDVAETWRKAMLANMPPETDNIMVRAVKLGPVAFCSFPFETFTLVGDLVRTAFPGQNIAVLGCGDHTRSYLPLLTPELADSYPAIAAALLYVYPVIAVGAAESIGRQIADGISKWY